MTGRAQDDFILVGKISKPHGIGGEVKIFPYSGNPAEFVADYNRLYLSAGNKEPLVAYTIEKARVHGKQILVRLNNCRDRTAAENISGQEVYVPVEDLPELHEDEFYLHQLENKQLVDESGDSLGVSSRILVTDGQDLLIVQHQGKEYMVPIVGTFIKAIDDDKVVVELPPGLIDINA